MRSAHARPPCRNRDAALCRFVALSLCRFVDTTRHHVAVCVRVSAIAAVVSHRIARVAPPSAGHVPPAPLPHCLGSRWLCCACSGSRPARRAAFFIPGRTSGEARQRCAHATVRAATTATGSGGPGKRSWRTAPKHCHAGPRRLRERPPSRRPHRWRHVRARAAASHARRQAPNAVRHPKHRARAHAPAGARPSADSRLSPRIGKPAVVTSASRCRAVCRQRRPPSADGFAARTCAAFFRRRNRQRASALPPPARRVIARDPPRPRSTPDNTPAADPGTRPSRAADTRAHRDRIRPSRSPRRADRIRRSSRRPRPR